MLAPILAALALVMAAAALYYAYSAAAYARQSVPKNIIDGLADLRTRVEGSEETVGGVRASMVQWAAEMEGVLTAVEDALGRVETKRRSTAAAASKLDAANRPPAQADDSDAGLQARAAQQGLWNT